MKVKEFGGYDVREDGRVVGPRSELKPFMGRGGYLKVCLSDNNRRRWVYVHRLVAECFIPNVHSKPEINHIDGSKLNNSASNLEWVTRSENNIHAFKNGLKIGSRGESNVHHKLKKDDILQIRKLRGVYSQRELSKLFDVSHSHISKIQRNLKWQEVA